ncbi:MAG: phage portal protein, partial [Planctomycetaceae bacterium]|nr:phage portal protein [Planctomycetaceae bacterium]
RVRTPRTTLNVVHGFLLDKRRRKKEAWITKDNLSPLSTVNRVGDMVKVPMRDKRGYRQAFHVYNPKRISQTRGITHLAAISDYVGMLDDIQFAKLVQQQIVSCFAIIRQKDAFPGVNGNPDTASGERSTITLGDGNSLISEGIRPGMEIEGLPGETISGFSPNVPNNEYFQHAHLILTVLAINLGLPVAVLLLDPSQTNFSGWRGAMDQARTGFKKIQSWMTERFHSPVYEWKVRQWLVRDPELRRAHQDPNINLFGHRWNPPDWDYIEPLKDATADVVQQDNCLNSPRRIQSKRGRDWEDVYAEIIEDRSKAIRAAITESQLINNEFKDLPQPIHWRELLPL